MSRQDKQERYRIGKVFRFEAARSVPGRGALEGHSFSAEVVLAADALVAPGFVADFGELAPVRQYIDANLDHRLLDDAVGVPATNERIADRLYSWCREYLPPHVGERLEAVVVRTGRPPSEAATSVGFGASHRLGGLPEGHQCGRMHGHSYLVSPVPGGALPPQLHAYVSAQLAGQVLNDVVPFEPTSELLARHLFEQALAAGSPPLPGVRVSETPSSWAEYRAGRE
ncbi:MULTISPECIES: 6-carboxytetrahydropterin synthase [Streptomyces]|uniref:6-carboxytetrahydropterin synthase n=1 Tax=Streptomyces TaxID=1883 RepID=UPI00163B9606|nr:MULTISPECIES: 6-carboxytetrahydropterin synthase [Streptomyces]MBC2879317.1 6-carboxytetrahydropterin synthase [Streptomyces sp. TYQ1024]UBI40083.1 6-carboxytetrahydropterin synthase [Streptomyces mobaraensis]UKW32662.1 6-carboxytetrahydropterin synthase [Streptomyces sp. TYQ1024]